MSSSARVDSLDAIKEFRAYLTKFKDAANDALGDADSDLNRIQTWLEVEQMTLWSGQIRKRQETLVKAEELLRHKLLYKDSSGSTPSAVEERHAVMMARKRLAEAQQKLANVKGWLRKLPKEAVSYRGGVSSFVNTVSSLVPTGIAYLGMTIEMLEKYLGLGPAPVTGGVEETASVGGGGGAGSGPSMARAEGDEPEAVSEKVFDPEAIRKRAPTAEEMAGALPKGGRVQLSCGAISPEQRQLLAAVVGDAAADQDGMIAMTKRAISAGCVYLLRRRASESSNVEWCIGLVDGGASEGYNAVAVKDLLAGREDFAELLKLPTGWLAVIDQRGVAAIYNQLDRKVFPSPTEAEAGGPDDDATK